MAQGVGDGPGGILGLVALAAGPNRRALDFDLLRYAGGTVSDIPGKVGWDAALSIIACLPPDSALFAETHPELSAWYSRAKTNSILADIYDAVAAMDWHYCLANTPKGRRKPQKPRPYPRPGAKQDDDAVRIGRGAIPIKDFDSWWSGGGD